MGCCKATGETSVLVLLGAMFLLGSVNGTTVRTSTPELSKMSQDTVNSASRYGVGLRTPDGQAAKTTNEDAQFRKSHGNSLPHPLRGQLRKFETAQRIDIRVGRLDILFNYNVNKLHKVLGHHYRTSEHC